MLIGLDYDGTYTADPFLWDRFLEVAHEQGHDVICFTMRYPHEPLPSIDYLKAIVYTSRKAKKRFAEEAGYKVNIWIDDRPAWLFDDALVD
jgi:hypothetical protein